MSYLLYALRVGILPFCQTYLFTLYKSLCHFATSPLCHFATFPFCCTDRFTLSLCNYAVTISSLCSFEIMLHLLIPFTTLPCYRAYRLTLPFCQFAIFSIYHFATSIDSLCHFTNLPFCQFTVLPHLSTHFAILPIYHFANLPFCQFTILPHLSTHFAILPFC